MARTLAPSKTFVGLRFDNAMLEQIRALADAGRRPFTTQVMILLEKGLATLEREERTTRKGRAA